MEIYEFLKFTQEIKVIVPMPLMSSSPKQYKKYFNNANNELIPKIIQKASNLEKRGQDYKEMAHGCLKDVAPLELICVMF